jgi:hypothetical protein
VTENQRINTVVETICQQGCCYVNEILRDADYRANCQPLLKLDAVEREDVINELKSVMSVYNESGNCDI